MANTLTKEQTAELLRSGKVVSANDGRVAGPSVLEQLLGGLIKAPTNLVTQLGELREYNRAKDQGQGESYAPKFQSKASFDDLKKNTGLRLTQSAIGTAGLAIPAGGAGASILTKLGLGALGAGANAFGTSSADTAGDLIKDTAVGAGAGALTVGGLSLLGGAAKSARNLSSVGNKLTDAGEKIKLGALKKQFGAARLDEGGDDLFREMSRLGYDKNPGFKELSEDAANRIQVYGKQLRGLVDDLDGQGMGVPKKDILAWAEKVVGKRTSGQAKAPYEAVIKSLQDDLANVPDDGLVPLKQFYLLKSDYGDLANWTSKLTEKGKNKAWKDLYGFMNDKLDEVAKTSGNDSFKLLNDEISNALRISKYANRRGNYIDARQLLQDQFQDTGILFGVASGGNPAAALGGMALNRAAESPAFHKGVGDVLTKFGSKFNDKSSVLGTSNPYLQKLAPLLNYTAPRGASILATTDNGPQQQVQGQSQSSSTETVNTKPNVQPGMDSEEKSQAFMSLLQKGVKVSDAKTIVDTLYPDKKEGASALTEKGAGMLSAAQTAKEALSLLEGNKASTGKLQSLNSTLGGLLGYKRADQQSYEAALALANSTLRNALLGASVSPEEKKALEGALPTLKDEKPQAVQKLKDFIRRLEANSKNYAK